MTDDRPNWLDEIITPLPDDHMAIVYYALGECMYHIKWQAECTIVSVDATSSWRTQYGIMIAATGEILTVDTSEIELF